MGNIARKSKESPRINCTGKKGHDVAQPSETGIGKYYVRADTGGPPAKTEACVACGGAIGRSGDGLSAFH